MAVGARESVDGGAAAGTVVGTWHRPAARLVSAVKQAVAAAAGCTIGSVVDALVGAVVKAATNATAGAVIGLVDGALVGAVVGSASAVARASAGGGVVEAALRKPDVWIVGLDCGLRARESAVFSRVIRVARGVAMDRSAGCWCRCCGSGSGGGRAALGAALRVS